MRFTIVCPTFSYHSRYECSRITYLLPAYDRCPCPSCSLGWERCRCMPTTFVALLIALCLFRLRRWEEYGLKKNTPSLRQNSWPALSAKVTRSIPISSQPSCICTCCPKSNQLSIPEISSADSFIFQSKDLRYQLPRSSKRACQPLSRLFQGYTQITTL